MSKKCMLIILDGWGHGKKDSSDAVFQADTPFVDSLYEQCVNSELRTDGENVGLPKGQMGNSEVGHMNIGAGRIVYQDLLKINRAIESGEFFNNESLLKLIREAKGSGNKLHFIGLIGDGGVHAHQSHLKALIDMAEDQGIKDYFIHAFTDGRDTDPRSSTKFVPDLEEYLEPRSGKIASVIGRYFAMDRDNRWERVAQAYDLLVNGKGTKVNSASEAVESSHNNGVTDEFITAHSIVDEQGEPFATIAEGDTVICFNFRTDRCREITIALTQEDKPEHGMKRLKLNYGTMTRYDDTFKDIQVIYDKDDLKMTLGEVLSVNGKTQLRIAETEKYPHVTFFFSGGREKPFDGESRIMVNSPQVATYDLQPEMSAPEVRDKVIDFVKDDSPDFVCLNFANPDMVGHTGVFEAIVKACETVDQCLRSVIETGKELGYSAVIIADHGNADFAVNEDGSPNTAHSLNPVPIFFMHENVSKLEDGVLANVAPTVLKIMGVPQPKEMTHEPLF